MLLSADKRMADVLLVLGERRMLLLASGLLFLGQMTTCLAQEEPETAASGKAAGGAVIPVTTFVGNLKFLID